MVRRSKGAAPKKHSTASAETTVQYLMRLRTRRPSPCSIYELKDFPITAVTASFPALSG